jgi:hypothetical protein
MPKRRIRKPMLRKQQRLSTLPRRPSPLKLERKPRRPVNQLRLSFKKKFRSNSKKLKPRVKRSN